METRCGIGYDVHRLVRDRRLVLGGVEIPSEEGLVGHSDADVVVHAIIDALFGAMALGDLGQHFPPGDPATAGISSLELLRRAVTELREQGAQVVNVDATVIAERPLLAPHVAEMRRRISATLDVSEGAVSIKATTHEGLGTLGRAEGIAASAIAVVRHDGPAS